ncbi:uncharacterized protein LOC100829248 isoform X2 [Brachypodium distachyon]|uniref:uncharacterized protein LOC100829248 isoform X2 n=1 Tax=Brachypodium distachyon TaxID=15368 RepID=UPI000D0DDFD2|nr:uncharacterized protein LOC100829248 isoform X2 [Brachypodium distachyon]|eukprot:XP_024318717.1 uncharacterized protein LOC100829248 isoform X2 [Brachypodium distachyon]
MEKFSVGLAKSAVEGTLVAVRSAIEEERRLKVQFTNDLVFIIDEFEMMQSFLRGTNSGERVAKNQLVGTWVRRVRRLAFDVEDCVEFVVHLEKSSALDWVRRLAYHFTCRTSLLPLDLAVAQIQELKARVVDVSQRNTRYSLLTNFDDVPASKPEEATTPYAGASSNMLHDVWEAAGEGRHWTRDLKPLIRGGGTDLEVISVWVSTPTTEGGGGGAAAAHHPETAYVISEAYDDPEIRREFETRARVKLMHPFDPDHFLESLLTQLYCNSFHPRKIGAELGKNLKAKVARYNDYLMGQLSQQKYLVILEDVTDVAEWDAIRMFLPVTNNGSRIVVYTAQHIGLARFCTGGACRVSELKRFSKGQSLCAFSNEDYKCSEIGGKQRSRLFHDTESLSYSNFEFQLIGRDNEVSALERQLQDPGVISVWGSSGFGKSLIVKKVYYGEMRKDLFESLSFVDLPGRDPFDLTDFSWQLLLDFYTRKPRIKEKIVNSLYKGQQDPIQACCRVLRRRKCLVVIDGLQFRGDWDKIRDTFFPPDDQPIKGCVVVITKDNSLARHCVAADDRVLGVERLRVFRRLPLTELRRPQVSFLYHLVGRDKESEWLRCLQPGVYSLWGVAGVGKSALVRDYCLRNQNLRQIWVDVPDPFDLTEFSRRLLVGYHSHDLRTPEIAAVAIIEGQDTVHGCRQILREITCLLIIDGLRSKDDWDLIRASFLSEHNDHTMIVISNEASVATHCASRDECRVFNVKGLKATHSLHLFRQIAWDAGKDQLTTEEREFSEAILAKCGGLPKVIVAIGEYASERIASLFYFQALTRLSTEIHHDFMGKLEMDSRFHSLRGLFCWMQSYFDACSDELKPCIFYLLVFLNIRRRRMLRRWIAEGYSAEDNAEMLFDQFVDLSIIQKQETPSSGRNMYQVNGFFLEYIKSRPMEDNLVFVLEEHYCSPNTQHTIQHLAIMSSWDRDQIVFESMDLTRLRSLTMFGEWMSFFISADTKMRLLRVLDLENTTSGVTDDDLEQILKLLRRLKFLSLRGCRDINRLPDSLGCLRQLQTLDVRHTKIRMLPRAIIKLVKLQYLRAGTTTHKSSDEGVLPAADEDGCTSICSQTPASRQGDDSDDASSSLQIAFGDGDVASTSLQIASEGDGDVASTSLQIASEGDGDGTSTRLQIASGGDGGGTSTSQQAAADGGVASTSQQADKVLTAAPRSWTRARDLVVLCRKKLRRRRRSHADDGSVVEVALGAAKEMGKLNALHTLGVVHVGNGAAGKAFLVELKKLTQLRKLAVSGINRKNWHKLYSAVSGHLHYLESLSVRIDKAAEAASFFSDEIFTKDVPNGLPKSLKSLKLYAEDGKGNVHVSPVLIKQLGNLTKFNFELTVSTQQDIDSLLEVPSHTGNLFHHLYVKPIQDGQLCYAPWRPSDSDWVLFSKVKVVEIDCGSYRSEIFLGEWVPPKAEVLVVHCSSAESSLELSGLEELDCVKEGDLKEVRLKGSYSEALKQHLQKKLDELEDPRWGDRPELKT